MNKPVLQDKDFEMITQRNPDRFVDALAANYFRLNQAERALGGNKHREIFKLWLNSHTFNAVEQAQTELVDWHELAITNATRDTQRTATLQTLKNLPLRKVGKVYMVDLGKVNALIMELERGK